MSSEKPRSRRISRSDGHSRSAFENDAIWLARRASESAQFSSLALRANWEIRLGRAPMPSRIVLTGLPIVGGVLAVGLLGGMLAARTPAVLPMQVFVPISTQPPSALLNSEPTNPVLEPVKVLGHEATEK